MDLSLNIQEYISSGILELYVRGSLSATEMQEVEEMANAHPEVRQEIEEIEKAVERMDQFVRSL